MPHQVDVHFSAHLKRFIELPDVHRSNGSTLRDVIDDLDVNYPGVASYLLHENGKLRQHVNLFLDNKIVLDREGLTDSLAGIQDVHVIQALSGG